MKYYWFSAKERDHQRAMGLWPALILADGKVQEFTTTTDHPVHSNDHRLVFKTDLY